jgi:hypothetical protein
MIQTFENLSLNITGRREHIKLRLNLQKRRRRKRRRRITGSFPLVIPN